MQHRPILGHIEMLTIEHRLDFAPQVSLLCQVEQQLQSNDGAPVNSGLFMAMPGVPPIASQRTKVAVSSTSACVQLGSQELNVCQLAEESDWEQSCCHF